jgi:hypothetical protein
VNVEKFYRHGGACLYLFIVQDYCSDFQREQRRSKTFAMGVEGQRTGYSLSLRTRKNEIQCGQMRQFIPQDRTVDELAKVFSDYLCRDEGREQFVVLVSIGNQGYGDDAALVARTGMRNLSE